jgi:hypothetical protein
MDKIVDRAAREGKSLAQMRGKYPGNLSWAEYSRVMRADFDREDPPAGGSFRFGAFVDALAIAANKSLTADVVAKGYKLGFSAVGRQLINPHFRPITEHCYMRNDPRPIRVEYDYILPTEQVHQWCVQLVGSQMDDDTLNEGWVRCRMVRSHRSAVTVTIDAGYHRATHTRAPCSVAWGQAAGLGWAQLFNPRVSPSHSTHVLPPGNCNGI